MSTEIRPEISKKSKYWLSKHRYYELLHWCRQYDEWWASRSEHLNTLNSAALISIKEGKSTKSIVEEAVIKLDSVNKKIDLIHETVKEADPELADYILYSVTHGVGYTNLKTVKDIPCSKNYFYEKYRRFFWLLDKKLD